MLYRNSMKHRVQIALAFALTFPWLVSFFLKIQYPPHIEAFLSGLAVLGSAFLLSWAAETAEMDVPRSVSLAAVALLAVLPEYAVDGYFAWMAGKVGGDYIHYATANMTGANRLLIGVGWSAVMLLAMLKTKRKEIELDRGLNLEIFFLFLASIYAFILPLKGSISVFDSVVFVSLYAAYAYLTTKSEREEFEPEGVPEYLCNLPTHRRRANVLFYMFYSGFMIFISVEAFSEGLLGTAEMFGIDSFLMVQWLAPLASEAPEFIVALYLVRKLRTSAGFNALISSKVNQWTLLIGTIAVIFSISSMRLAALPLDARQSEEVLLTAAQSVFALAVIMDRRVNVYEAVALLALFLIQFALPSVHARIILSIAYMALAVPFLVLHRKSVVESARYVRSLAKR
ncbi:sodium:calcium symporter [Geoglobus acetivorans]